MFKRSSRISLESRVAEAFFEQSPDGMLLIQGGVFAACNAASSVIYDRPRHEIIGRSPVDFSAPVQTDGRSSSVHVSERLGEALSTGQSRFEWLNINSRGEEVRILVTLLPTRIDSDQDVLVIVQNLADTARVIDSLRHGLNDLAKGNLACHITQPFRDDYEGLRHSFNRAVDDVAASMQRVIDTAKCVATGSSEIERAAHDLSLRTEQQAAKVDVTVNALQQIGETMAHAARSAQAANQLVESTRSRAQASSDVVSRTVDAMSAIESSSREISDIISVIDAIAFQTNLLALNAGVEAARAGDAGRGFAVVASEVRALAQRSADAAKDIKARIQGSAEHVANGVEMVTETGKALARIAEGVSEISDMVGAIAVDTQEQARRLEGANATVEEMGNITQSNAATAEETSAAARALANQSTTLIGELDHFEIGANTSASVRGDIPYRNAA